VHSDVALQYCRPTWSACNLLYDCQPFFHGAVTKLGNNLGTNLCVTWCVGRLGIDRHLHVAAVSMTTATPPDVFRRSKCFRNICCMFCLPTELEAAAVAAFGRPPRLRGDAASARGCAGCVAGPVAAAASSRALAAVSVFSQRPESLACGAAAVDESGMHGR
jgi:hypothetical protein